MFFKKKKNKEITGFYRGNDGMSNIMEDLEILINGRFQSSEKIIGDIILGIDDYNFLRESLERHAEKKPDKLIKEYGESSRKLENLTTLLTDNFSGTKMYIKEYGLYYLNEKDIFKKKIYEEKYNQFEKSHNENVLRAERMFEQNGLLKTEEMVAKEQIK